MIGVWVEVALTLAACLAAVVKRAELRAARDPQTPYTPRHSR